MTWLKLIANAVWAGIYGSLTVAFLFFFLNDELVGAGVVSPQFGRAVVWSLGIYTPVIALLLPTLYICLRFFAARRLEIPWLSLKTIVWLGIATLLLLTIVYYRNLRLAGALVSPAARDVLRILCTTMAGCWILAMIAAALAQRRPKGRRTTHRVIAGSLTLAPVFVMMAISPFMAGSTAHRALREAPDLSAPADPAQSPVGYGPPAPEPRLLFIGVDAATMDIVLPLVSARQLPVFERLLKEGASARLDSIRPCSPRAAWCSLMTGLPPWVTGVKGGRIFSFGPGTGFGSTFGILPGALGMPFLERAGLIAARPSRASSARRPMLGGILAAQSIPASVIGWPDSGSDGAIKEEVSEQDARVSYRLEKILGPPTGQEPAARATLEPLLRRALALDLSARAAATDRVGTGRLLAVRLSGLGRVSRAALRYHVPDEFGDVSPGELAAFGPILTRYYQFLDTMISELIATLEKDGTPLHVMVVSAYGVSPSGVLERFVTPVVTLRRRDIPAPSGTWSEGPDGILLVHGPGVIPGARLEDAGLLNVLPTALYLLGSPVSDELKGNLLRRLFTTEYLESHPMQIVRRFGV